MADPIDRRSVLGIIAGGLGALWTTAAAGLGVVFVGSSIRRGGTGADVRLVSASALGESFQPFTIDVATRDGWYTKTAKQTVYARLDPENPDAPIVVSATCTHLGCTVGWRKDVERFMCPCHGGRFDAEGKRLSGPPPSDLARIPARVEGSDVLVTLG